MLISCCLIGFGRIGQIHYKNITFSLNRSKWKLLYIVESQEKIDNVNEIIKDPEIIATSSLETALNDPKVNCVFICSPTNMHHYHIITCLKYNKHVFCEKPIDETIENINHCYDYAEKNNLHLFCALNRRFDNEICKLKTNIHSIGNINQIISITRDYPYPNAHFLKNSSGLFNDCALHDIDYINWILDDKPKYVYVTARCCKPSNISADEYDDSSILMEYSSGIRAFIYCSRISKTYDQRVEIFGDQGILTVINPYGDVDTFTNYDRYICFQHRYEQSYMNELEYFYNVIVKKESMLITKEDCLTNLRIIKACQESCNSKKRVEVNYDIHLKNVI